ncbi:lysophospholipid acyltransferase family protein [Seleniivibrio woodruffii]|uniref:lysophospholipid acyltransferase family protein n=1 Tax=Seleniivibrio woodruffii TaxID=1078050 RepID=UPI002408F83F|nr:lysophospholipid acyltransferase family protein [Seleniivibrio woodruffii]
MYLIVRALYAISGLFSFQTLRRTGMVLGTLYYHASPSRRRVAEKNAELIGVSDPKSVAKNSFRHSFATFAEALYSHRLDREFAKNIEIENLAGDSLSDAKGDFLITAHIGCWELAAVAFTEIFDRKVAVIGRKMKDAKVNEFLVAQRETDKVLHISHRSVAEKVPECLDSGISVGALLDHSAVQKDSIFVPFFGHNTTFIKGIPMLTVRKEVRIIPAFLIRTEKTYKLVVYPAIEPDKSLKPKERIYDIARRVNMVYEEIIRRYPDQWYLLHKRFKKIMHPDGTVTDTFYK